jgi:hypothetical protein
MNETLAEFVMHQRADGTYAIAIESAVETLPALRDYVIEFVPGEKSTEAHVAKIAAYLNRYLRRVECRPRAAQKPGTPERRIRGERELQALVQDRLDNVREATLQGTRLVAREIYREAPDSLGCNWNMRGYVGPVAYFGIVRAIVDNLRSAFNLPD